MNKRGISAVVATVLIILITVAGVTIIWGAIIPMIRDNLDFSSLEGRVYVVTSGGYTFYDAGSGLAKVQVKRDMDDGVMNRIKIDFSVDGNSVSSSVVAPDPGNTKVYTFDLSGYGEPDSVSVAPIFVSGSGKEKIGSVTSNVDVGTGVSGAVPEVEWYELNKEYFSEYPGLLEGLVAHYDFEGDVLDGSGNGNDGIISGGVGFVDGISGQAADFNGINDYINISNFQGVGITEGKTLCAWSYANSFHELAPAGVSMLSCGSLGMRIDSGGKFDDRIMAYPSGTSDAYESTVSLNSSSWNHVCAVWKGNGAGQRVSLLSYFNGQNTLDIQTNIVSSGGFVHPCEGTILIGADIYAPTSTRYWDGLIDEVRIYNRSLSAEEIAIIYEIK